MVVSARLLTTTDSPCNAVYVYTDGQPGSFLEQFQGFEEHLVVDSW